MYDICCIGHLTRDKIITSKSVVEMAGGTSFYFSNAIHKMDVHYILATSLAESEMHFANDLRNKQIEVNVVPSFETVFFENNYAENQDYRTQRVLQKSDPFAEDQLKNIDAKIFHLGPLLADDISINIIKMLSKKGKVSLDVQGYLREVKNKNVFSIDWPEKKEALQHVHILKANEIEMETLTGSSDVKSAAEILHGWGVQETVITLGSKGSVIYDGNAFYTIPAFAPATSVVDATGCGDTYMAGYLYQRIKEKTMQQSGEFAAAMATLKIESSGPFTGTENEVNNLLMRSKYKI